MPNVPSYFPWSHGLAFLDDPVVPNVLAWTVVPHVFADLDDTVVPVDSSDPVVSNVLADSFGLNASADFAFVPKTV